MVNSTAESYVWWQHNGNTWLDEIRVRKAKQVYYHLQELLLFDYFQGSNFQRILEFGCGFGRHLRYLREIPNIEVYGYDQSEAMIAPISQWAGVEWVREHIKVGQPNTKLPYSDRYFDAVFTNAVLIHVPPEDVPSILKELMRISKYQIIHQEPAPHLEIKSRDHGGCWNHNLVELYHNANLDCEILEPAFELQRVYRVVLNAERSTYTPSSTFIKHLYELESCIQPTINQKAYEAQNYQAKLLEVQAELKQIKNSRSWKLIESLRSHPLLKFFLKTLK